MKTLTKKTKIILLVLGLITLVIFFSYFLIKKTNQAKIISDTEYKIPTLSLPLNYFTDGDVMWGSVNTDRDSDDYRTWKYATVDEGYRSFPTTTIQLSKKDYSNESETLHQINNNGEIYNDDGSWKELYDEQIKKYGDLAKRFLPSDYITNLQEFDVDGDGVKEKIVSICGVGGNHCPHEIFIIKKDKIIFSVSAGLTSLDLKDSGTGNGFYVQWVPTNSTDPKWDVGLCCPPGYISTRFVFDKNSFTPIYEQENLYLKVENTK